MQHDKNEHHGTGQESDEENTRAAMDRNRDVSAGETTGDSANADQQSKLTGSHDSTGYPTGNTDGQMRQEQVGGEGQMGSQRRGGPEGQNQGQPNSQGQGQPSAQNQGQPNAQGQGQGEVQSGAQNQPWGQGQDGGQSVSSDRTAQATGQGFAGTNPDGTRAHTTDTANQGEQKEEEESVSAEHGNEGSGWHGGGGSR